MDYCAVMLFALLFASGVSKGQTSAREVTPIPRKNPRDVETVLKMKYFQPIRLEKLDTIVPELQATIRELNSESNDILDSDQSDVLPRGDLTDVTQPEANEGDVFWTTWSGWQDCSVSCGEGLSSRTRTCMSRYPTSDIDLKCDGQSVEYKLCRVQECTEGSDDYRSKQCSDHDDERHYNNFFKWEPYSGPEGPTCELQCTPSNSSNYHAFLHSFGTAGDGTRCGRQGVCINGECRNIGCDGIVGSNRKKDQCGVCDGNNSTCVHRFSTEKLNDVSSGYHELAKIPKGATNVVVKDYNRCYLALFEMEEDGSRSAVLNADWLLNPPNEYKASDGVTVRYSRNDDSETIEIEGPTKKTFQLMTITMSGKEQPYVDIDYWIPPELSITSKGAVGSARRVLVVDEANYLDLIKREGFNGDEVEVPSLPTTTVATTTTQEFTTTTSTTQATRGSPNLNEVRPALRMAQCNPYKKSGGKKKMFCDSDIVLDVRILPWHTLMIGRRIRYMVDIVRQYKANVRLSRKEYIWLPISCHSKIRFNQPYLIMGRANAKSTNHRNVKVSKFSNRHAIGRFPREYAFIGKSVEMVRFSHKHYAKMTRMAHRVKCRKNRRGVLKYGRRRVNSQTNVNKR